MSLHSYSRVWLHLVWATIERRALLQKPAAAKLSGYLHEYAQTKGIYMKIKNGGTMMKTVETVFISRCDADTPLKRGVNEMRGVRKTPGANEMALAGTRAGLKR